MKKKEVEFLEQFDECEDGLWALAKFNRVKSHLPKPKRVSRVHIQDEESDEPERVYRQKTVLDEEG